MWIFEALWNAITGNESPTLDELNKKIEADLFSESNGENDVV